MARSQLQNMVDDGLSWFASAFERWRDDLSSMLSVPTAANHHYPETTPLIRAENGELWWIDQSDVSKVTAARHPVKRSERGMLAHEQQVVALQLPVSACLDVSITLPRQAERHLRDVVPAEVERLTPFLIDEMYWDHVQPDIENADADLTINTYVVRCDEVDRIVKQCDALGYQVTHIGLYGDDDALQQIDFMAPGRPARVIGRGYVVAAVMLFAAAAIVWMALVIQSARLDDQLAELANEAASLRPLALVASDSLSQQALLLDQAAEMHAAADYQPKTTLLDEMARLLPDHTWVKTINAADGRMDIAGTSKNASMVAEVLSQSNLVERVTFTSPIKSLPDGAETFSVQIDLVRRSDG